LHLTIIDSAPVFTSTPVTGATTGSLYSYTVTTADADAIVGDTRKIEAVVLPNWLTLLDHGDGTATLSGKPTGFQVGNHNVVLKVTDAAGVSSTQSFTVIVRIPGDGVHVDSVVPHQREERQAYLDIARELQTRSRLLPPAERAAVTRFLRDLLLELRDHWF